MHCTRVSILQITCLLKSWENITYKNILTLLTNWTFHAWSNLSIQVWASLGASELHAMDSGCTIVLKTFFRILSCNPFCNILEISDFSENKITHSKSQEVCFWNVVQARFIVHLSGCAIKIEPGHKRSNGVATWFSDKVISFHVKSKSSQPPPIVLNSIHLQFTLVLYLITWDYTSTYFLTSNDIS